MERKLFKSACNAAPVAADFAQDANGFISIKHLPNQHLSWLQLITTAVYRKDTLPLAEVAKVTNIALAGNIVANEKYGLLETLVKQFREGTSLNIPPFKYTAPAILGAQATEKHNMYVELANKINAYSSSRVTAYPVVDVPTTATDGLVVGDVVTGATSGASGICLSHVSSVARIALITTTVFDAAETIDDQSGNSDTTAGATTLGVKLRIVDNGNYFNAEGNLGGESTWTKTVGFLSTDITVQSRIVTVAHLAGNYEVGEKITDATLSFAAGTVLRNITTTNVMIALLGEATFLNTDVLIDETGNSHAATADAIAGVATAAMPFLPYFSYSQGQGAKLLAQVPVKEKGSDNWAKGDVDGPMGDAPVSGTEYVQIEWSINIPGAADAVGASGGAVPRFFRYFVPLANYAAVDGFLDGVGITN